jgi:glyoxylase-like metal-dependent hydrolase (beta-lactamase superfamily II)
MQLTNGIFKADGVRVANVYVVETEDGLLLVDTGIPGSAKRICRFIEAMARHPSELRDIVLTHFDIDHVGSTAARLVRADTSAPMTFQFTDDPVARANSRSDPEHQFWSHSDHSHE